MPESIRQRLARWIAGRPPAKGGSRMYAAARQTRTTGGFGGSTTSADAELQTSLTRMRQRSRQMVRDSAYAKRAKTIVVNNVIGAGVGLQAQVMTVRQELAERVNSEIEQRFAEWSAADACHTGGALHFADLERAAMGEVFEAGECLIRKHFTRFGSSRVPLALELVEAERLAGEFIKPGDLATEAEVRMGVEVDGFGRAVAYWLRAGHPGDIQYRVGSSAQRYERVPADEIIHLRLIDRWPQTRGVPWLHTVLRKLDDMAEYTGLELQAARGSAAYFATLETPEPDAPSVESDEEDGQAVMEIEPLMIQKLAQGEQLKFHAPNRPNTAMDPFMRAMLREVAAGVGPSYESLSRDYSQSNYSSSRLALLDDRDLWRVLQGWWVRSFRQPLHRLWMQQAVLSGALESVPRQAYAVDPLRYEAARFKCRGWSWVDPTKEVDAYVTAIRAGLTTVSDVIAQTAGGLDLEDVIKTRRRELDMLAEADIQVDTTVVPEPAAAPAEPADDAEDGESDEDGAAARVHTLRRTA